MKIFGYLFTGIAFVGLYAVLTSHTQHIATIVIAGIMAWQSFVQHEKDKHGTARK